MSWNQDEPPTNPYRAPDWQFQQFQQVPTAPAQPPSPPPRRRAWVLPAVAAGVAVVLVGGAAGAYLLYGRPASSDAPAKPTAGTDAPTPPAATQPAAAAVLDVCAMLPVAEVDRLVPQAAVAKRSREAGFAVYSYCDLSNRRISHGEFWRSREIKASIAQHRGEGPKTGRAQAQSLYDSELGFFTYKAKNEPTDEKKDPGEKNYNSAVKHYPGVGDGAFGQYTWSRDKALWYSYGEGRARVGDMIIEVRYQASQQRKDAEFLTSEGTQSVSEENALREVGVLLTHLAKGAAAWKAAHPGELAKAEPSPSQTPTPTPSPSASPTVVAQLPVTCRRMSPAMMKLVPGATERAKAGTSGGAQETECRWLNLNIPAGKGKRKIRSAMVTIQLFANRAGAADSAAAKSQYSTSLGNAQSTENSALGGIRFGKIEKLGDLGDEAYLQYWVDKKNTVFNGSGDVLVRVGPALVRASFAGAELGVDEATNSPKVKVLGEKEAREGVLTVARAIVDSLGQSGLKKNE
ncbi:hypothetical protein AB0G06_09015 [Nonomuraea dietziae]|uniref:hypothetical protein n=1 Tax=Nonomuraea dietziae TaxID=65515 RepID=UPI0034022AC7